MNFIIFLDNSQSAKETYHFTLFKCITLSTLLPGKGFYPDGVEYQASIISYWSQQEEASKPSCVAIPASATDIATAVKLLRDASLVVPRSCKFAIRNGG